MKGCVRACRPEDMLFPAAAPPAHTCTPRTYTHMGKLEQTCTHQGKHDCNHTDACASNTYTYVHTYMHTCTYTHTQTLTYRPPPFPLHTHTHTHTDTPPPAGPPAPGPLPAPPSPDRLPVMPAEAPPGPPRPPYRLRLLPGGGAVATREHSTGRVSVAASAACVGDVGAKVHQFTDMGKLLL